MAEFCKVPGADDLFRSCLRTDVHGGHRPSKAESPINFSNLEYQEAYSFKRKEVKPQSNKMADEIKKLVEAAAKEPQSNKMPDELKKRVEAAAKEFNFTMADIDLVEKALRDQNSRSNLVENDVKIRVAAAIKKYKFTPEDIAIVQKAVREEKSSNGIFHRGGASNNNGPNISCFGGGFDGNGVSSNAFGFSGVPVYCRSTGPYLRGGLEVGCNIL